MKYTKIIMFVAIILTVICICNITFAKVTVDKYKPSTEPTMTSGGRLQSLSERIIGTITTVGIIVSVVGLIILGIKYMMGSIEEKASYKKTLIPMIVGLFFILATSTIITMVYNLTKSVEGKTTAPKSNSQVNTTAQDTNNSGNNGGSNKSDKSDKSGSSTHDGSSGTEHGGGGGKF